MKRRTTAFAAALSLLPLGQPLLLGSNTALATAAVVLSTQAAHAQSAEDYVDRGNSKYRLRDYQAAIADYSKAIEINPQLAPAYYNRGFAKDELEDYQGAIADLNKAIEINPQLGLAYANRGLVKYKLGDKNGFCSDAKKAVSLGAQSPAKWLNSADGAWCRNMR